MSKCGSRLSLPIGEPMRLRQIPPTLSDRGPSRLGSALSFVPGFCARRRGTRLGRSICLLAVISMSGCSHVNWQATYDAWAASLCREEGSRCGPLD
jgi:hypothetical protein